MHIYCGFAAIPNRKEAQQLVEQNGAKYVSAFSSNLDYFVVAEKGGAKLNKAKELGTVTIGSEEEFLNKLNTKDA